MLQEVQFEFAQVFLPERRGFTLTEKLSAKRQPKYNRYYACSNSKHNTIIKIRSHSVIWNSDFREFGKRTTKPHASYPVMGVFQDR